MDLFIPRNQASKAQTRPKVSSDSTAILYIYIRFCVNIASEWQVGTG